MVFFFLILFVVVVVVVLFWLFWFFSPLNTNKCAVLIGWTWSNDWQPGILYGCYYYYYWWLLCSAILHARVDSLRCCRVGFWMMSACFFVVAFFLSFARAFLNIHRSGVLTPLAVATGLMPHEAAAVSALVLCIPFNHEPDYCQCHFISSHIRTVHVRLFVTCHLHFGQNDQEPLSATAIARRWNGYRN